VFVADNLVARLVWLLADAGRMKLAELMLAQAAQDVRVQLAVRQPPGEVAERADPPPREPGLAELARSHAQQLAG
jgi:hypothetical protein